MRYPSVAQILRQLVASLTNLGVGVASIMNQSERTVATKFDGWFQRRLQSTWASIWVSSKNAYFILFRKPYLTVGADYPLITLLVVLNMICQIKESNASQIVAMSS